MKTNHKLLMSSVLATILCLPMVAVAEIDDGSIMGETRSDYIMKTRKSSGVRQVVVDGNTTVDERGTIKDDYYDSVIYMDTFSKKSDNVAYVQVSSKGNYVPDILATPASDIAAEEGRLEMERQKKLASAEEKKEEIPRYFGGGYCRMKTPTNISKSSEFSTLSCLINFGKEQYRKTEIFVGIYPDYEREMLIALPIYATFENGSKSNVSGVVMKENKGSVNIADYVDNKRLRRLIGEAGLATNDIAYRYSVAYMTALQASKVREEVQYVSTVDPITGNSVPVPIATTNIEPPKATDFFAAAGIELVSQLFAIGAKEYLYNSDPLFKVYAGKRVWVEGVFEFDNAGIAKRFGRISESEIGNIDNNNNAWKTRRDQTINKYDKKKSGGLETVLQRQN